MKANVGRHASVNMTVLAGIIRFTQLVKLYEKQDTDVARLNSELRSIVMPQMAAPELHGSAGVWHYWHDQHITAQQNGAFSVDQIAP